MTRKENSEIGKDIIKVRLASEDDGVLWDSYVKIHEDATPYHLYAWKQAVASAYGHKGFFLIAVSDNHIDNSCPKVVGILPLIYMKIPFGRGKLISLPFCDAAGPLSDDKFTEQRLIKEALKLGKEIGVNTIELRTSKSESALKTDIFHGKTNSHKVRMLLDISDSPEKLLKGFKSKLRSQIKKPEKEGLRFEWGDINKLNDFYRVFSINMKHLGSPVHSRTWFSSVLKFYADKVRMGLVYLERQIIGCGIILIANKTVTVPWASTLKEYNYLSPNMMLYWNFLAFASDSGYTRFDFGRSTPNEGTYRFKAQWGAKPHPLHWHYLSACENAQADIYVNKLKSKEEINTKGTRSIKREIAAHLWSKLPLCVANALGTRIRKYISL